MRYLLRRRRRRRRSDVADSPARLHLVFPESQPELTVHDPSFTTRNLTWVVKRILWKKQPDVGFHQKGVRDEDFVKTLVDPLDCVLDYLYV